MGGRAVFVPSAIESDRARRDAFSARRWREGASFRSSRVVGSNSNSAVEWKANETDGSSPTSRKISNTREVSSGADSTITIVSLGRIERRNLALPRARGRFSRIRNTNQPASAPPSANPARIRAIPDADRGPVCSHSRQSTNAPTTRPIAAEIAASPAVDTPLSRSFPLAEARSNADRPNPSRRRFLSAVRPVSCS